MQMLPISPRLRKSSGIVWLVLGLGLFLLVLAVPLLRSASAPAAAPLSGPPDVVATLRQLPLAFVPHQEQGDTAVLFEARAGGRAIAFTAQEIRLHAEGEPLRLRFLGANEAPVVAADTPLPGKINDLRGNDPAQWQTNLPAYAAVTYRQLYPGIDVRYEGTEGLLKSTFTVAPGADPAQIRWHYSSATAVAVDSSSGDLRVTLPDQSQLVERAPVAWQESGGERLAVPVAYETGADGSIGFALGRYDSAAPLIIDPTIVYETNVDLGEFDKGEDIVVDAAGNAYVLGGLYELSNDVFVAKLSPDGALLYVTYLRGSCGDFGGGIALDGAGDVYIAGGTDSADFPILNARQATKNSAPRDAFIAKLAGADGTLQFSTYFGGGRSDIIQDVTLNDAGEIFVVGYTESTDFPTVNPIQGGLNLNQCFCEDTFVTRLSGDAMTVLYSTYLGGSFEDYGQSIALDGNENIYVTGRTQSDDYPTEAALQPNRAGQNQDEDLFVSKIAADGSRLVYSTYLGGTESDSVRRIAVDDVGNAFVAGSTQSVDFPTTACAFQEDYVGGVLDCGTPGFGGPVNCTDIFVTKFTPDGRHLAYSTYVGGGLDDNARGIAINNSGEAFVVGYTNSADFPGAAGSANDILLLKLNAAGSDLLYTVNLESTTPNAGHGVAVDTAGDVYITASQPDLLVAKIGDDGGAPAPTPTNTAVAPMPTSTATAAPPTPTSTPIAPTPTNTSAPGTDATMHVGDVDGDSAWTFRQFLWQASATVTVHDADHNPVAGALVSGAWSGGYAESAECTTGSDGACTVTTGNIRRNQSTTTFTVNAVTDGSFTYAPADNHDPEGDSNGSAIVVSRP